MMVLSEALTLWLFLRMTILDTKKKVIDINRMLNPVNEIYIETSYSIFDDDKTYPLRARFQFGMAV